MGRIYIVLSQRLAGLADFLERPARRFEAAFWTIPTRASLTMGAICLIAIPVSLLAPAGPGVLLQVGGYIVAASVGFMSFRDYWISGSKPEDMLVGSSAPRTQFTRSLPIHTVRQGLATLLCCLVLAAPCVALSGSAYGLNLFLSGAVMSAGLGFLPLFFSGLIVIPLVWGWTFACSMGPWVLAMILSSMTLFAFDSAYRARGRGAIRRWGSWAVFTSLPMALFAASELWGRI